MSWTNIFQHVDKNKLPWAKRATEHIKVCKYCNKTYKKCYCLNKYD